MKNKQRTFGDALFLFGIGLLAVFGMGTRACTDNYVINFKNAGSTTTTTSGSSTTTTTDDGTVTTTTDGSVTTTTEDVTTTTSGVETTTTSTTVPLSPAMAALKALEKEGSLSPEEDPTAEPTKTSKGTSGGSRRKPSNWLGRAFTDDASADGAGDSTVDSDGDGYVDGLEEDYETDVLNPNSRPGKGPSSLAQRLPGLYNEHGALSSSVRPGFRADRSDSGLDSDGDGLSDAQESILGTDQNSADSDRDGIYDGREVEQGNDPLVPEWQQ